MGVGTVYLILAGVATLGANFFLHVFLAHKLSPELYGIFGILISVYMILGTFLSTGMTSAVSRFIAEEKYSYSSITHSSLKLQLSLSLIFTVIYLVFVEKISWLLGDLKLTPYLIIMGLIIIPFTLLSLHWTGYLNGLRLFKKQALISFIHVTLKAVFVSVFVLLGFELYGFLLGLVLSILLPLVLVIFILRKDKKKVAPLSIDKLEQKNCLKELFYFSLPLIASSLILSLLRNVNLLLVKSLLKDNLQVAIYTAANTFANVPILIFASLFFTLVPSISKAISEQNFSLAGKYVSGSFRYLLLLLLPIIALVVPTSTSLVNLFYPLEYSSAGTILNILIVSSVFLIIMTSFIGVIIGLGKPKVELLIGIVALAFLFLLNILFTPDYGLAGAAYSLLITMFFTALISGVYVYQKLSFILPFNSILNLSLASVFIFFLGYIWKSSGFWLLVQYGILILVYLLVLFLFKEFNQEDYDFIKRVIRFK